MVAWPYLCEDVMSGCQVVSMQLLGCYEWLPGCFYVISMVLSGCQGVSSWLLEWLPGHICEGVVSDCQVVSMQFLGCYEWLPGRFYVVDMVL